MESIYICAFLFLLIIIPIIIYAYNGLNVKQYEAWILNNDTRLQELFRLNEQTRFSYFNTVFQLDEPVDSRQKYNSFNFDAFLYEKLKRNRKNWEDLIHKSEDNKKKYEEYKKKLQALPPVNRKDSDSLRLRIDKYLEIEERLYNEYILSPPVAFEIRCRVIYSSPAGRIHLENKWTYGLKGIKKCLEDISNHEREKETEEFRRKEERQKMTPGLRYEVMKRDGFKCVLCGRCVQDGIKLHVDHVIPISKGGKTEMNNLRTLCQECNLGKGSKIE